MSTANQIAANQANAQLSTGPKTETGKAASSQNSWKHGLFGVFRVLDSESQMAYQDLLQSLQTEYNPATPTEAILVERMAQHHWLRNRALHYQNHYLESGDESSISQLSLFMRYETMHERAFHKCLADLLKLRAEKQKQEIGFASQAHKERMRELDILCREQDVRYREVRTVGAELHLETNERRQNQEAVAQKAA
ncbi:MAG TPA: hypothetical protein VGG97_13495 [Bryobacteraceae bacterium]|jgi:hypothetical protein